MKILVLRELYDNITNQSYQRPMLMDLDLDNYLYVYKTLDNFTMIETHSGLSVKVLVSFWDLLKQFKEYNDLDVSMEELVKIYDKGSSDDFLMNGI